MDGIGFGQIIEVFRATAKVLGGVGSMAQGELPVVVEELVLTQRWRCRFLGCEWREGCPKAKCHKKEVLFAIHIARKVLVIGNEVPMERKINFDANIHKNND